MARAFARMTGMQADSELGVTLYYDVAVSGSDLTGGAGMMSIAFSINPEVPVNDLQRSIVEGLRNNLAAQNITVPLNSLTLQSWTKG